MVEVFELLALAGGAAAVAVGSTAALASRRTPVKRKLPSTFSLMRQIGKLPPALRREARQIVALAQAHDERKSGGHLDSYTARETLRAYLPDTIAAYLLVPAEVRSRPHNGHPAADVELAHQLYALRVGLEKMRDADADAASQRMQQNKTFLHDRFGAPPPFPSQRPLPPILEVLTEKLATFLRGA